MHRRRPRGAATRRSARVDAPPVRPVRDGRRRQGPSVAVEDLAVGPPGRPGRAAPDRRPRPGPRGRRRGVPAGLAAAPRAGREGGRGWLAALLTAPGRHGVLRVLPARRVRRGRACAPACALDVPGVQPRDDPQVRAQRRQLGLLVPGGPPVRVVAGPRHPCHDVPGPRGPARRRAETARSTRATADVPGGAGLRRVHGPARTEPARLRHLLQQPRGVGDAPVLGGDVPDRLRRAGPGRRLDDSPRRGDPVGDGPGRDHAREARRVRRRPPGVPGLDGVEHGPARHDGPGPGDGGLPRRPGDLHAASRHARRLLGGAARDAPADERRRPRRPGLDVRTGADEGAPRGQAAAVPPHRRRVLRDGPRVTPTCTRARRR